MCSALPQVLLFLADFFTGVPSSPHHEFRQTAKPVKTSFIIAVSRLPFVYKCVLQPHPFLSVTLSVTSSPRRALALLALPSPFLRSSFAYSSVTTAALLGPLFNCPSIGSSSLLPHLACRSCPSQTPASPLPLFPSSFSISPKAQHRLRWKPSLGGLLVGRAYRPLGAHASLFPSTARHARHCPATAVRPHLHTSHHFSFRRCGDKSLTHFRRLFLHPKKNIQASPRFTETASATRFSAENKALLRRLFTQPHPTGASACSFSGPSLWPVPVPMNFVTPSSAPVVRCDRALPASSCFVGKNSVLFRLCPLEAVRGHSWSLSPLAVPCQVAEMCCSPLLPRHAAFPFASHLHCSAADRCESKQSSCPVSLAAERQIAALALLFPCLPFPARTKVSQWQTHSLSRTRVQLQSTCSSCTTRKRDGPLPSGARPRHESVVSHGLRIVLSSDVAAKSDAPWTFRPASGGHLHATARRGTGPRRRTMLNGNSTRTGKTAPPQHGARIATTGHSVAKRQAMQGDSPCTLSTANRLVFPATRARGRDGNASPLPPSPARLASDNRDAATVHQRPPCSRCGGRTFSKTSPARQRRRTTRGNGDGQH
ncbi:hypothetical protein, conserved in T. vivax [Trypanosoma vivax Y486]|uniref:Transmembrane protein n=1 Tax=Trypanosoma vivax (strain Y486) TaxID=1055687 RepID=F9WQC4_TRYVY|nr:hypothetical protein, conserved in T. vivax [Trypanosoma vivax Y486]|eukprot:CCD19751.1 hypothetical protein, conserved in T. vivax [Trypanosoma vivax Y486]